MHIFSWLTRMLYNRTDLSMFDPHSRGIVDFGAECRKFVEKGCFVEINFGTAEGTVRGNEARTGTYKGGAKVSAG